MAYNKDPSPLKVNLGVGAYRTEVSLCMFSMCAACSFERILAFCDCKDRLCKTHVFLLRRITFVNPSSYSELVTVTTVVMLHAIFLSIIFLLQNSLHEVST